MGEVKDESVPQAWAWPQEPCPGGGVRSRGDCKHPTLDLGLSAKLQRIFRKVGHSPSISPSAPSSRMTRVLAVGVNMQSACGSGCAGMCVCAGVCRGAGMECMHVRA